MVCTMSYLIMIMVMSGRAEMASSGHQVKILESNRKAQERFSYPKNEITSFNVNNAGRKGIRNNEEMNGKKEDRGNKANKRIVEHLDIYPNNNEIIAKFIGDEEKPLIWNDENETELHIPKKMLGNFSFFMNVGTEMCRTRDGRFLPYELFSWDSCANCYKYEVIKSRRRSPTWSFVQKEVRTKSGIFPVLFLTGLVPGDPDQIKLVAPTSTFKRLFESVPDRKAAAYWHECCVEAANCCANMITQPKVNLTTFCPRTWDGWRCWNDTAPATDALEACPKYSYSDTIPTCTKFASKRCGSDGLWYRKNGVEWSNYLSCGILPSIKLRILCHVCTLSLSVIALLPALVIFTSYRQLRVHRIALHTHLFLSLLLEAILSISFRVLQLYAGDIISQNPPWCVALSILRKYARETNYMWYFCEGFYLHKLLASAFAEQRSLSIFYFIGWGFPLIPVSLYTILRGTLYLNSHCWEMPVERLEWMILLPPLFAILMNVIFIFNIVRILLGKVRSRHDCEPSQYRMAVRATLMVVPLFGLQYVVTIYRPVGQTCYWLDVYHILNNIIDGSTGFIVSIIFCFANGEVQTLLKRSLRHKSDRRHMLSRSRSANSSIPLRSRSISTAQTTFLENSRRSSSIVSTSPNFTTRGSKKSQVGLCSLNEENQEETDDSPCGTPDQ